jgi:6-phosphogluconolactonase/glucosamine-6-phosphate isomerase/deaminase
MTLPAINHARHIWFLVTGAKKAAAFARAQKIADPACPASLVEPVQGELRWYIDQSVVSEDRLPNPASAVITPKSDIRNPK